MKKNDKKKEAKKEQSCIPTTIPPYMAQLRLQVNSACFRFKWYWFLFRMPPIYFSSAAGKWTQTWSWGTTAKPITDWRWGLGSAVSRGHVSIRLPRGYPVETPRASKRGEGGRRRGDGEGETEKGDRGGAIGSREFTAYWSGTPPPFTIPYLYPATSR